jgi:two-component system, OmpR family, phosphate regulon sensor histidine kinase PhoR
MTRKLKYAIGLAVITGVGIIVAQLYWLIQSYQVKHTNFTRSVESALNGTVFQTIMEKDMGMSKLTIFVGNDVPEDRKITESFTDTPKRQTPRISVPSSGNSFFPGIDIVDSRHPPVVSLKALAPVKGTMQDSIRPSQLNIEDKLFLQKLKENLQRSKIDLPFELSIESPEASQHKKHLATYPGIPGNASARLLLIDIPGMNSHLLRSMLPEILLSVGIIIIACISFYYLLKTIYRQKQFAEMKNDFISNISHELKTPVSVMMATNEALIRFNALDDKEKTERYLVINRDELNKLQGMIERIVSIGKQENTLQPLSFEKINLDVFLQKIINRFTGFENLQLQYSNKLGSTDFSTNADALETILTNLIDNAVKYNDKLKQQVWIDCKPSDNGICITVHDNGIGIEKKYLPFVFDKFYRVPQGNLHNVKGFGLGLSQVKELVEQLKGTIEVISQPGSGTQFIINLPSHAQD